MENKLHFCLWALGLRAPHTSTTLAERAALYRHARGKRRLVEIGVWQGLNTAKFRELMQPDGVLFAVDPFFPGRYGFNWVKMIAHSHVKRVKNGTVIWEEVLGHEAAKTFNGTFHEGVDFIFIDGDHSYEGLKNDWLAWTPLVASGGIVALHDSVPAANPYVTDETGAVIYRKEAIDGDDRFERVEVVDSLSIYRRQ
jgi:predicted O-methyltransferase YrrM